MSKTALLVIDLQNALVSIAHQPNELLNNVQMLLTQARETEVPVIYMQHADDEDDDPDEESLAPGTSGFQLHSQVRPLPNEQVIVKTASDSFYRTSLAEDLEAMGIERLVISGMRSERCVDTTSRVAVSSGFDVTIASDAHSTTDSDSLTAQQIIQHTNENLDEFGNTEHEISVQNTSDIRF